MASVSQYDRGGGNRSVVVCGGQDGSSPRFASCEELSLNACGFPVASRWRSFTSLPSALNVACMLHVNGAVGVFPASSFSKFYSLLQLYHIGGYNDSTFVSDVYVYDETSGQWQPTTPLPQPLVDHKCVVLNCQGLVCGGFTADIVFSLCSFPH